MEIDKMNEIMTEAEAKIEALRPYRAGDYTAEKYGHPEPYKEELSVAVQKREAGRRGIKLSARL